MNSTEQLLVKYAEQAKIGGFMDILKNIPSALGRAGNTLNNWNIPGKLGKGVRIGAGAAVVPYLGEGAYRTFGPGGTAYTDHTFGGAPTTTGAYSSVLDAGLNVTGIGPAIAAISKHVLNGANKSSFANTMVHGLSDQIGAANDLVNNPTLGKAVQGVSDMAQTAKNLTNPDTTQQTIDRLRTGASDIVSDTTQSAVKGLALAHFKDPKVLASSLAVGAGPLIAYDLYTKKRREEKAKVDRMILQKLTQQKTAGALDVLKRVLYSTKTVPTTGVRDTAQSLFNNSLSRNPIKSLVVGSGLMGTAAGALGALDDDKVSNTLPAIAGSIAKGTGKGLVQPIVDLETPVFKIPFNNDFYKNIIDDSQEGRNLKQLGANAKTLFGNAEAVFKNNSDIPGPAPIPVVPPETGFMNWLNKNKGPMGWYAAGAGALAAPLIAHKLISKSIDRNVDKETNKSNVLKERLLSQ